MQINEFEGHKGWVYGINYIDNDLFCTSGDDRSIRLWNVHQKKAVKVIFPHSDSINFVFNLYEYLGENVILTGSADNTMKLIGLGLNENKGGEFFSLFFDDEIFLCSLYVDVMEENVKKIFVVTLSKNNSRIIRVWSNFLNEDY